MLHNTLYRLQRGQKKSLLILGILFLNLSALWLYAEVVKWWFPMEPLVVFVGGLTTLLAIYWPITASNEDERVTGRIRFDYETNSGNFEIGENTYEFTLMFTKASDTSIHMYRDPSDIQRIALASDVGQISDIKDVSVFDFTNRRITPTEGQIVCLENTNGNFACLQIHDIRDSSREDEEDEVTFSFVINRDGGTDFS
ncbi:hypothetical protein [Ahrensia sp. 13_GOM-1096m]|uniref:hypothetical protein n=1 Tax=Ahrensia sp. 13_GOM-1096m TaxID=1380380 RepID=UPI000686FD17|nr:hypothetical protein [Ahrensia sp. 13_GOM-1096m]